MSFLSFFIFLKLQSNFCFHFSCKFPLRCLDEFILIFCCLVFATTTVTPTRKNTTGKSTNIANFSLSPTDWNFIQTFAFILLFLFVFFFEEFELILRKNIFAKCLSQQLSRQQERTQLEKRPILQISVYLP